MSDSVHWNIKISRIGDASYVVMLVVGSQYFRFADDVDLDIAVFMKQMLLVALQKLGVDIETCDGDWPHKEDSNHDG